MKKIILTITGIIFIISIASLFTFVIITNNNQKMEIIELKESIKNLENEDTNNQIVIYNLKSRILELEEEINTLNEKNNTINSNIDELEKEKIYLINEVSKLKETVEYAQNGYNYLAIGNSITIHGICDYWYSECGMGASKKELDYFHLVNSHLEENNSIVKSYAVNFNEWETQYYDRAETLTKLDKYLSPNLDLITIQLSENVIDASTLEEDYIELINYISLFAYNAKILMIDDYWDDGGKELIKKNVAESQNITFLSLDEIKNNPDYQLGTNATVYDDNENPHTITKEAIKNHPNDLGMKYIADLIIANI